MFKFCLLGGVLYDQAVFGAVGYCYSWSFPITLRLFVSSGTAIPQPMFGCAETVNAKLRCILSLHPEVNSFNARI